MAIIEEEKINTTISLLPITSIIKLTTNNEDLKIKNKNTITHIKNNSEEGDLIAETTLLSPQNLIKIVTTNSTIHSSKDLIFTANKNITPITTKKSEINTILTTTIAPITTIEEITEFKTIPTITTIVSTTTQFPEDVSARVDKCFEVIDGYIMNNTAGGLERDVSLEECECFCVNSLYVF